MRYPVGALVRVRQREWVVQAESSDDLVILKPLGGSDEEVTGVLPALEPIEQASFKLPDPQKLGDHLSCRLLRDAMLLGFRSTCGPFRSFGHLNVDPRPYQFVPLLMALRQEPVRLLIADDVGVGKTIEAGLIVRELIDRGEISSMAVLCPPHLAEQWQRELLEKFHIEAELVISGSASRLERNIGRGQSLFEAYPFTIVSLDYIKSDQRRNGFKRSCPDLVVVDEAHTCTEDMSVRGNRQQRWELLRSIADLPDKHILLLTATPHSGKEGNFRSMLSLLDKRFLELPADLSGEVNRKQREFLSHHFVQRRRADVIGYMADAQVATMRSPFPDRNYQELTYSLSPAYHELLDNALDWARAAVQGYVKDRHSVQARVQWWSALALLHAISSSPAAAEATMLNRSAIDEHSTATEIDSYGHAQVLDGDADELAAIQDIVLGSDHGEDKYQRRRLGEMAKQARSLYGDKDTKLTSVVPVVERLLRDGYSPILFCRYIDTAKYLAEELPKRIDSRLKADIWAVTGQLAPDERKTRIELLGKKAHRVLIATDCLSEGINLQDSFDAVIHYDLAWNPTRHEQREGRIDRYGQPNSVVRTVTYYGKNNPIDGMILKVLIQKHESIRRTLGISVPIPMDGNALAEAVMEYLLISRVTPEGEQLVFEELLNQPAIVAEWTRTAEMEKRSRALFAQHSIQAAEIVEIWKLTQQATGTEHIGEFLFSLCRMHGIPVELKADGMTIDFSAHSALISGIAQAAGTREPLKIRFALPVRKGESYINRTHPLVEGLANHIFLDALDDHPITMARRAGVMRTDVVTHRTVLLLIRARYGISGRQHNKSERETLAEDCFVAAFRGQAISPQWLVREEVERLLDAKPLASMPIDDKVHFFNRALDSIQSLSPHLSRLAMDRAEATRVQNDALRRVAEVSGSTTVRVIPAGPLPVDVLGIYVLIPYRLEG